MVFMTEDRKGSFPLEFRKLQPAKTYQNFQNMFAKLMKDRPSFFTSDLKVKTISLVTHFSRNNIEKLSVLLIKKHRQIWVPMKSWSFYWSDFWLNFISMLLTWIIHFSHPALLLLWSYLTFVKKLCGIGDGNNLLMST